MQKRIAAFVILMSMAGAAHAAAAMNIPWVRNGSAQPGPTGNTIITQEVAMQAGSVWNPCSFNISNTNFNICTEQFFGDSYCGADGMAFVLQTGGTGQLGANSGEHGYSGIGNSLAIALDTYTNPGAPYYDPAYHTFNLNRNGGTAFEGPTSCAGQFGTGWATGSCRSQASGTNAIISDNAWHTVCYTWDFATRTLAFSFDGMARGSWVLPADYITSAFGGNSTVYYGFTASTGGAMNYQEVRQTSGNLPTNCVASPTPNANTFPATTLDTCGATPVPTFTPPGPTYTPTITPTPYPPGCGPPVMLQAGNVAQGCYNASNPITFNNPGGANELMVIHVETGNGSTPSSITYNGLPATQVRTDNGGWGNAQLSTFYIKQPTAGSNTLTINMPASNCSWNVAVVLYTGVDQTTPIGGTNFAANSSCPSTWSNTVTVVNPASILDDFMAIDNLPASTSLGAGQTSFGYATGCCNNIYGSWKTALATGATSMTYTPSQCKNFASQLIEIRGYSTCNTPTRTVTRTFTQTFTPVITPTFTVTLTATRTATPTVTRTVTPTATRTATPTVTRTATVTNTPVITPTFTATSTATRTATVTVTQTATPTRTSTTTVTFTPTRTATPTLTLTRTPSTTVTATPTATRTSTTTITFTATPTRTVTRTVTFTPTATPSYTTSITFTSTPTATRTATATISFTATPSRTVTTTVTFTPTATPSATTSITFTVTRTATPSSTRTVTPSQTPTRSATPTVTVTYSASPLASDTVSPTITLTSTPTPTRTATRTATPSATTSITFTVTPTATPTATATISFTATRTASPSSTTSASPTQTATRSVTPTITATYSASPIASDTVSPTITVTRSSTPTVTATPTESSTVTRSVTASATPTLTGTRTQTSTASATPTATPTFTDSPVASPTNSPTATPSRTASPTATPTRTATPSSTESPANTLTATPTSTPSFTLTDTRTVTRTATPTATRTVTRTATPSFTATPTASPSATLTATFSFSPTFSHSPTASPTPVPEPFHITLAIYNEAGERVRVIFEGAASTVGPRLIVSSTVLADGSTQVSLSGFTSNQGGVVLWNASNDNGQSIDNGVYYAKLSSVDAFGSEQSYSEAFSVLSTSDEATVEVFNSAGERVRSMSLPGGLLPVDMRALEDSFVGGLDASGQPLGGLRLRLKDNAGEQPLLWDGLNDQGEVLASGSYTISLTRTQAGGARVVKTLSVVMLSSVDEALQASLASAQVAPNPVRGLGMPIRIAYKLPPRGAAVCRLYDLAGQLVAQGADLSGSGVVALQNGFAGGVYLVEFRIQDGQAILGRKVLKAAVVR